jgi:sortase A
MQNIQQKRNTGRIWWVVAALLFILVGTAIMLYPKLTDLRYALAQSDFAAAAAAADSEDRADAAQPGQEDGIVLPDGAVALLQIPAIGLEAYVVEGTDRSALANGPGHYPDTPLPGERGNSAIAGHRTMYGAPFNELDLLEPGDKILTATSERSAVYRVTQVLVVYPTDLEVVAQTGPDRLTLTTCHPEGHSTRRLVVVAELTE